MQIVEKPLVTRRKRWVIAGLALYLCGLHVFAIVAVFKTDIIARAVARVRMQFGNDVSIDSRALSFDSRAFRSAYFHIETINQMMRKSPVVFLGDSITEGLPPFQDMPRSLNLGLGGNTIPRAVAMIGGYPHIDQVAALVLNVGINDLCNERPANQELERRFKKLSAALSPGIRIVWSSILPVDPNAPRAACLVQPDAIRQANSLIADLCNLRAACVYSDGFSRLADTKGYLAPQFHVGDGVHLSPRGYEVWSDQIRRDLVRLGAQASGPDARSEGRTDSLLPTRIRS